MSDETPDHWLDDYLGSSELDATGEHTVDIFKNADANSEFAYDLADLKNALDELGGYELDISAPIEQDDFSIIPIPDDFDFNDPDVRGPFLDFDAVLEFLKETGLYDLAEIYQDAEDMYYVKVTSP